MTKQQVGMGSIEMIRAKTIQSLNALLAQNGPRVFSTEELAALCKVRPATIRRAFCVQGHFNGLVPTKMHNRRLIWHV